MPLKYIDIVRRTSKRLDVMQESRIDDYWNVDGGWDLLGIWTYRVHNVEWNASKMVTLGVTSSLYTCVMCC